MKETRNYIAESSLSVGCMVTNTGKTKIIYRGELFNPLTWIKFERVQVIKPMATDHVAIIPNKPALRGG